jgi:hypothetical protein
MERRVRMKHSKKLTIAMAVLLTISLVPFSFAGEPRSKKFLPDIPRAGLK